MYYDLHGGLIVRGCEACGAPYGGSGLIVWAEGDGKVVEQGGWVGRGEFVDIGDVLQAMRAKNRAEIKRRKEDQIKKSGVRCGIQIR